MIEYLDHATLLNRQRGGYFTDYVPLFDDVAAFKDMRPRFYHRFLNGSTMATANMHSELTHHFEDVQTFANEHSAETGTSRYCFEDELRESALREGLPHIYNKSAVLMVVVGKDNTLHSYLRRTTFWEDNGQASSLTADYLRRLTRVDYDGPSSTGHLNTAAFPFVNLWQWLWHRTPSEAAFFLREYFRIVQPIIAVSLSRQVNELTKANFMHQFGTRLKSFITSVGDLSIQYHEIDEFGQPNPESAFINIPHIHPGFDKYGSTNPALRRVLDLSWHKTFLVASIAMDKIDQLVATGKQMPSRAIFCESVLAQVEKLSGGSQHNGVFREFRPGKG